MDWLYIIFLCVSFFVASYFLFYKPFLEKLGEETAKLMTVEKYTELQEKVKAEFNRKMAELKSELDRKNVEYQIQFSLLHSRRADAIVELHARLVSLLNAVDEYTNSFIPANVDKDQEKQRRFTVMSTSYLEFVPCYTKNKLFFNKDLCNKIDLVLENVTETCRKNDFVLLSFQNSQFYSYQDEGKLNQLQEEVFMSIQSLHECLVKLEDDFRNLLYVEVKKD